MPDLNGSTLIKGDGKAVAIAVSAESGTLVGAAIRFALARLQPNNVQTPLLTLTRASGAIAVSSETAGAIAASFVIPGSATSGQTVPRHGCELQWDLEVTPSGGQAFTLQGVIKLIPDTAVA